ncbi:3-oxoacyl-[acyl-carrier protein] reductase [[Actinomadura] parvosata subsp. kistnae]|uniref:Short-chain dehydrogenase n=1 Tax=[Actinomadura] parvosata subsp. kistnae TaxID=1909395 RepID=A0A1U9ZXI9_9ACTN|nr:SDR family oxidoreductase [Nonomuraea sp. ATCC 55076]AQZ62675.1 short-chain dehydrogenase [Nonomuraea sp. ATCC 55076]SPL88977.1 3-oxoacyl-[acyl-carrier protein] reductase [Actinomadura parvosata subsp. kistnae]
MTFTGKTALITGSGAIGGLGHATARILAAGGADVIITGTDPDRGAQVVADVRESATGTVRFVPADLADPQAVQRLADDAGAVDILVNNAGVVPFGTTPDQDLAAYDAAFAVNVRAPFLLVARLAPKMAAAGGGSIVNVSSTAARLGLAPMAVYGATKAALESLTRTWAAEFAAANVRVNAVAPGPMTTSKVVAAMGPDVGGMGLTTALRRAGDPAEVAHVIAFLAGDQASYMTGAVVAADGGRTAI